VALIVATGRSHRPPAWRALRALVLRLEALERWLTKFSTWSIDPFGSLLRSVDPDVLPLDRVDSAGVHARDADSGSLPDLTDFVVAHYPRLIRLAGLITRNTDDAEDAVQAALERAWRNRSSLRDQSLLKQWIDRIVVREASRISGSRVRRLARLFTSDEDGEERAIDLPDSRIGAPGDMAEMREAFEKLSTDQRTVVTLHLYAGYTVIETAEIVGVPVETVRSRLRLARQRLRNDLERSK
jgi:RNA polymerase sigma-70 factor (ECF subfamily)